MEIVKEHITLILLLGGSGNRFESSIPKQFLKFSENSEPLFIRSLMAIEQFAILDHLVLVVNKAYIQKREFLTPFEKYQSAGRSSSKPGKITVKKGENTRHQSFLSGASAVNFHDERFVLVHDANRPYFSETFSMEIAARIKTLSMQKACLVPVVSSVDSLCKISTEGKIQEYIPRDQTCRIQTPQLVYAQALDEAVKKSRSLNLDTDYTDEGSFMMSMGFEVYTFPGDPGNIKITTREDVP